MHTIGQSINDLIGNLGKWSLTKEPTNEQEFLDYFKLRDGDTLTDGAAAHFNLTWDQVVYQQQNAPAIYKLNQLRAERDRLIAETDWWVLPDRTPTEAQLAYRQALRDITNTYTSLDDVVFPQKPE